MAYDKITTEYMVRNSGDQWFPTVITDGTPEERLAECVRLSPNGVEVVTVAPIVKPTIGTVTISGKTNIESGEVSTLSVMCSGNATDLTYRWSTGCGSIAIVGPKTSTTVQVSGISATSGNCWLLCTVTSPTASDASGDAQAQIRVTVPEPAKTVVKTVKK